MLRRKNSLASALLALLPLAFCQGCGGSSTDTSPEGAVPAGSAVTPAHPAVGDAGRGVASLTWELPPSKVDGSPLDDLAGYRILYGRHSDDLDQSVFVGDAAATSWEIDSLGEGLWYFAVIAVNASGLEGPPTTVASKSI